ncbi:hypothetical protein AURDEDRAFT_164038 [Auricularia subglabra TFB-10046 SS5]|nr:hypothetical protein AURDEDRAFT_164038 [Auricularia subglabra TFB-10046 SS5]
MFSFATFLLAVATGVNAYSFYFSTQPTQCQPLTVNVVGQGKPPYRLILADGNPVYESGRWTDVQFSGSTHTIDALQWSGDSQIVAMLSDQDGIGTGGTSELIQVTNSTVTACNPHFQNGGEDFHWDFQNAISSCQQTNVSIWSDLTPVKPPLSGFVILVSGQSFALDLPPLFKNLRHGWFQWEANLPPNSVFIMGLGDANGDLKGTMHYPHHVGDSGDKSCYDVNSPQVTSNPAGKVSLDGPPASTPEPTDSTGTGSNSTGQSGLKPYYPAVTKTDSTTVGIVAGVLGTIIVLLLIGIGAFAYWWRTSYIKRVRESQVPSRYSVQSTSTQSPTMTPSPFLGATVPVPYVPPPADGRPLTQKERRAALAARPGATPSESAGSRAEGSDAAAPLAGPSEDHEGRRETIPPPYAGA